MGRNWPLINAIRMNILSKNRAVIPCRIDILRLHTNHNDLSLSEVNKEACKRPDPSTECYINYAAYLCSPNTCLTVQLNVKI